MKGNKEYIGLKFGDEITFNSSFEAPYTERNEGGFDYSSYLKTKKFVELSVLKRRNKNIRER